MKQKFTMPDGEVIEKEWPVWKTPFNHDTNFESDRTALYCPEESLTKQEFKESSDINVILDRFMRTQELPPMALPEHFADTTTQLTYHEAQTRLAEANAMFYRLDAQTRAEFLNDPSRWADAVVQAVQRQDADTLEKLGIDLAEEKAKAAAKSDPPSGDTPAPKTAKAAAEAAKDSGTESKTETTGK